MSYTLYANTLTSLVLQSYPCKWALVKFNYILDECVVANRPIGHMILNHLSILHYVAFEHMKKMGGNHGGGANENKTSIASNTIGPYFFLKSLKPVQRTFTKTPTDHPSIQEMDILSFYSRECDQAAIFNREELDSGKSRI